MAKSLYETLNVTEKSTNDEIKKAYRKLARKFHPDVNKDPKAEEKFKEINAAYEVLGDKNKKQQYDQHGDSMFGGQNFHDFAQGQGSGVDLNDILSQMFGGNSGFSQQGGFGSFNQIDLDINAQINIAFDVSIKGGKQNISLENDSFDIKIPEGIKDGQKIRAKGKGKHYQGQRGDLIIKVNISPSIEYKRDDLNLNKSFELSLKTALFGGKVSIQTIHKDITLKVPQNTKQNQKFRVKNLGVLNRKDGTNGDLYLIANILLPKIEDLDDNFVESLKQHLPDE